MLDVVFDVYGEFSIKQRTRDSRSVAGTMMVSLREDTPLPKTKKDLQIFLRNDQNKTELFEILSEVLSEYCTKANIFCTKGINVLCNTSLPTERLSLCNHEEADIRPLVYVNDIVCSSLKRVTIVCTDIDAVVITLNAFYDMLISELWIEFGSGKIFRWLPIHTIAEQLGEETCRALPFWYAFTGCDTVSAFAGKGKKTAWETWNSFPEATSCFMRYH